MFGVHTGVDLDHGPVNSCWVSIVETCARSRETQPARLCITRLEVESLERQKIWAAITLGAGQKPTKPLLLGSGQFG